MDNVKVVLWGPAEKTIAGLAARQRADQTDK